MDDIFTGDRVPGATVTVAETGDERVVCDDGVHLFEDLPEGDYAVMADGQRETTIDASGTFGCSISLFEAAAPTTSDAPVGSTTDRDSTGGATSVTVPLPRAAYAPVGRTSIAPSNGHGCGATGGSTGARPVCARRLALARRRPGETPRSSGVVPPSGR